MWEVLQEGAQGLQTPPLLPGSEEALVIQTPRPSEGASSDLAQLQQAISQGQWCPHWPESHSASLEGDRPVQLQTPQHLSPILPSVSHSRHWRMCAGT